MANTWFVDRDGQERGPFTAQQLKAMATKGEVLPSDLVRRDDAKDWRLASSVKGLFELVAAPKTTTPPLPPAKEPKGNPQPDRGDNATSVLVNPVVIAVSVLFCFPVGLFLVWRHPTWGKGPKWAWTGAVGVVFTIMMVVGILGRAADQKTLAEADTLWQSGDKADDKPSEEERIQLLVMTASTFVITEKKDTNITPEQFNAVVRSAAKELGCDKHDDTRHLLQIEPSSREVKTLDTGNKAIIVRYGPRSANTYVSFFQNTKTGQTSFFAARVGDKEVSALFGVRPAK